MKTTPLTLAFDVYGTLVNPAGMSSHLTLDVGAHATAFAALWREKQIEYSFRRGLMRRYVDFSVCTAEALEFTVRSFAVVISKQRQEELLRLYQHLEPYPDAVSALPLLATRFRLFAFSNGTRAAVEAVLRHAGLREYFEDIVSVDDVKTFKPDPLVYAHARRATGAGDSAFALVSANAFDVIGARSAGLDAYWIRRSTDKIFDPWEIEPTATASSLLELVERLEQSPPLPSRRS